VKGGFTNEQARKNEKVTICFLIKRGLRAGFQLRRKRAVVFSGKRAGTTASKINCRGEGIRPESKSTWLRQGTQDGFLPI
jgi:hypothetical protein